jgi:anti-anti-sigma factor
MEFSTDSNDRTIVISVSGRLDFSTSDAIQKVLDSAVVEAKGRALIVDCISLDYASSTGLRCFLIGAKAADAVGVRFMVCGLKESVTDVFKVSGFLRLIPTFPDRVAAEAQVVS